MSNQRPKRRRKIPQTSGRNVADVWEIVASAKKIKCYVFLVKESVWYDRPIANGDVKREKEAQKY